MIFKSIKLSLFFATKGGYHPILENGKTLAETTKAAESGKPIFENFKEDKLIPELMASYNKLPQEIKQGISEIKYAPSKTNKDLINVYMNDGNRVIVNISDLSEKMAYYSQVAEQMDKPGIVDMEVGIFLIRMKKKVKKRAVKFPKIQRLKIKKLWTQMQAQQRMKRITVRRQMEKIKKCNKQE